MISQNDKAASAKAALGGQQTSAVCSSGISPRQKLIDSALLVAVDNGGKRGGQIHLRINGVELTGLNERGDGRPVLGSGVMARKERVLPIEAHCPFILPMSAKSEKFTTVGIPISAGRSVSGG